jgi:transcriptional regulator with XRE-family HTH domain
MDSKYVSAQNLSMTKVRTNFKPERRIYFFKQWRKHRGLTQETLGERIGLTPSSISQLETGKQGFTDSTLEAIADALNCSPGDLLMRDPLSEDSVWSIHDQLQRASPEKRQQVIDFVEFVMKVGAA